MHVCVNTCMLMIACMCACMCLQIVYMHVHVRVCVCVCVCMNAYRYRAMFQFTEILRTDWDPKTTSLYGTYGYYYYKSNILVFQTANFPLARHHFSEDLLFQFQAKYISIYIYMPHLHMQTGYLFSVTQTSHIH